MKIIHRFLILTIIALPGCAIHYYDADSQVEHLWGIGHMRMKTAPAVEDNKAIVKGFEIYGLGLGVGREEYYLVLGWDRRALLTVLGKDTSVRLEWPSNDLFEIRVGSRPPFMNDESLPGKHNQ